MNDASERERTDALTSLRAGGWVSGWGADIRVRIRASGPGRAGLADAPEYVFSLMHQNTRIGARDASPQRCSDRKIAATGGGMRACTSEYAALGHARSPRSRRSRQSRRWARPGSRPGSPAPGRRAPAPAHPVRTRCSPCRHGSALHSMSRPRRGAKLRRAGGRWPRGGDAGDGGAR
jgi:hypothetical protein